MDPMDQLYDKFMGKIRHEAVKIKREAKRLAELETPLEKSLREATSNQNWGCPNSVLYELAQACTQYTERQKILKKCWERLDSKEDKWRRILKTLTLLDYLVKHGPEQVVVDLQGEQSTFRKLLGFKCTEDGHDRGAAIRDRTRNILDLLADRDRLKEEREKAKEHQSKLRGTSTMPSNEGGGGGRGDSGGASSIFGVAAEAVGAVGGGTGGGISRAKFEERFNELKRQKEKEKADKGHFEGADSLPVADESAANGSGRRGRRYEDEDDDKDRPARRDRESSDDRRQRRDSKPMPRVKMSGGGRNDKPGSDSDDDGPSERPRDAPPMSDLLDMCDGPAPAVAAAQRAPAPSQQVGLLPPPGAPAPARAARGGLDDFLGESPAVPASAPAASEDLFGDFQGAASSSHGGHTGAEVAPAGDASQDLFGDFQGAPAAASGPAPAFFAQPAPPPAAGFAAPALRPPPPTGGGMIGGSAPVAARPPAVQPPAANEDLMTKSIRELDLTAGSPSPAVAAAKGGPPKPAAVDVGDAFEIALGGR